MCLHKQDGCPRTSKKNHCLETSGKANDGRLDIHIVTTNLTSSFSLFKNSCTNFRSATSLSADESWTQICADNLYSSLCLATSNQTKGRVCIAREIVGRKIYKKDAAIIQAGNIWRRSRARKENCLQYNFWATVSIFI